MAGYTRQSIADIINGSEVTAPPLNAEFNQLAAAFAAATGHSHDGTSGNAPKIDLTTSVSGYLPAVHGGVGGKNNNTATTNPTTTDDAGDGYAPGSIWENTTTGRVYICVGNTTGAAVWRELVQVETGNVIVPAAHDTVDLGSPTVRFQDLYLSGGIAAATNVSVGGTLTILGSTSLQALTAASATIPGLATLSNVDINGGAIDGTAIGASSASTGAFTTLTAANATVTSADINGGTIDGTDIGVTSRGVGNFTTVNSNAGITGNLTGNVTGNVTGAVTGNVTGNITSSGTSTFATVDINGGAIDGTAIGAAAASTVRGTTITATTGFTGNLTGNVTGNTTGTHTGNVTATSGTTTLNNLTVNGSIDVTNAVVQNVATPTIGTDAANKSYVDNQIAATIDAAPGTLDTLNELAAALGDDPNFATTVSNSIATKVSKAGDSMTGSLSMGGNKVTGLADPTVGTDAVTKNYVDTVYGSVSSAAASATAAATSASSAEADRILVQGVYDTFDDRYLGAKASDPLTDNDGNALITGALYFDSSNNVTKVYNGAEWQAASSSIEGIKSDFLYTATASQTLFSGVDSNGNTLVIDQAGLTSVFMNGVRLVQGSDYTVSATNDSVTLLTGATAGDTIEIEVFGNFAGQSGADVAITGGSITGLSALGVAGNATFGGNTSYGDNNKAIFGAGSDLQIYHDGSNSYVREQGTGSLRIQGADLEISNPSEIKWLKGYNNDRIELFFNNSKKLATTSTGVDVTGTVTADGLTVDNGAVRVSLTSDLTSTVEGLQLTSYASGAGKYLPAISWGYGVSSPDFSLIEASRGSSLGGRFHIKTSTTAGAMTERFRVDENGDISFYEDTGTTAKLFWDASAEALELGSPTYESGAFTVKDDITFPNAINSNADAWSNTGKSHIKLQGGNNALAVGVNFTGNSRQAWLQAGHASPVYADAVDTSMLLLQPLGGKVGIGTSAPQAQLQIAGADNATSLKISGTTQASGMLSLGDGNSTTNNVGVYRGAAASVSSGNYLNLGGYSGIVLTTGSAALGSQPERMRIDASGNVGIGTSSPAAKLHVTSSSAIAQKLEGTSTAYTRFALENTNADKGVDMTFTTGGVLKGVFGFNGTNMNLDYRNGANLTFSSSAIERMRIDSSGNVGIGTSSPSRTLSVVDATNDGSGGIFVQNYLPAIELDDASAGGTSTIIKHDGTATIIENGGSERMRIDASGNVGIGTSSPASIVGGTDTSPVLSIGGTDSGLSTGDKAGSISFITNDSSYTGTYSDGVTAEIASVAQTATGASYALAFYTGTISGSDRGERLRIDASGNVGIGTGSPAAKLEVKNTSGNADIRINGVNGGLSGVYFGDQVDAVRGAVEFSASDNSLRLNGYNNTERMRIDASGNLLVGATGIGGAGGVTVAPNQIAGAGQIAFNRNNTTSTSFPMDFRNGGSTVGYIAYSNTSVTYATTSDYRLKEDWQPMTGASDRVLALKPVNFAWKSDGSRVDGFLAHEAQAVVPESVSGTKDAVDADGKPIYQGIDQSKLVPLLTAALQEALKRIEALEAQLNP